MSWDKSEEIKEIKDIGTAHIFTSTNDWNKVERHVILDSETHHSESIGSRHHRETWTSFYAVPNGMTINPQPDLPKIEFQSFSEKLCNDYNKTDLSKLLKSLKRKGTKFEYPINRDNALGKLASDYYRYYKAIDRNDCIQDVNKAITDYDGYKYNYDNFKQLRKKAEKEQHEIIQESLKVSKQIF